MSEAVTEREKKNHTAIHSLRILPSLGRQILGWLEYVNSGLLKLSFPRENHLGYLLQPRLALIVSNPKAEGFG